MQKLIPPMLPARLQLQVHNDAVLSHKYLSPLWKTSFVLGARFNFQLNFGQALNIELHYDFSPKLIVHFPGLFKCKFHGFRFSIFIVHFSFLLFVKLCTFYWSTNTLLSLLPPLPPTTIRMAFVGGGWPEILALNSKFIPFLNS